MKDVERIKNLRYTRWYTCGGSMSSLLKLKDEDLVRIENVKSKLKLDTKVSVLRYALELVEKEIDRSEKIKKWERVAKRASKNSMRVNKEFYEGRLDD